MAEAVNESEQFVYDMCRNSFLSLWSYVNPRRKDSTKELCDVLVVCDPHVIVISVKESELKDAGKTKVQRDRWQRKTIDKLLVSIKGAVRSLDGTDVVVAKDGSPGVPLPPLKTRVYHRIAVAFGGGREVSLSHPSPQDATFVHILDEEAVTLLLLHLDTISDFTDYLSAKEELLARSAVVLNGGEEDLLAMYLHSGREFPPEADMIMIEAGLWQDFSAKPEFLKKLERDELSHVWDNLIEMFCGDGFEGEDWLGPDMPEIEPALRLLAQESRFNRRILGIALKGFLDESRAGVTRSRCVKSLSNVGYVFFTYPPDSTLQDRQRELQGRCLASLLQFTDVTTIVGVSLNVPGALPEGGGANSLAMLRSQDGKWPEEYLQIARKLRDGLGYFEKPIMTSMDEDEYPTAP